jgi:hypothetical protein
MLEIFFETKILGVFDLVIAEIELLVMNLGTGANVFTCVGKKSVRAKANQRHLANIVIPEVFHGHVDAITIAIAAEKLVQSLDETLVIAVSRHSLLRGETSLRALAAQPLACIACAEITGARSERKH